MGSCHVTTRKRNNPIHTLLLMRNMNSLVDLWPPSFLQMLKSKFKAKAQASGLDHTGFRNLFCQLKSPRTTLHIFQCFDLDGNGRLDFKEFCIMLSIIFNSDEQTRLAMLFHFYDYDKDGQLSRSEMEFLMEQNDKFLYKREPATGMHLEDFKQWVDGSFDIIRYFEMFELLPGPLKERERIREILKHSSDPKHYYVVSYKWWELWRFYINYNFSQSKSHDKNCQNCQKMAIIDFELPLPQVAQELENQQDEQGQQGSVDIKSDPNNPKWDLKHGICESHHDDLLQPIDEGQSLRPGPIDNSDIQGEFEGELRQNILNNHDYLLLPQDAWDLLVQWYGCYNNLKFKRKSFYDQRRRIIIVDLYPPLLKGFMTNKKGELMFKKSMKFKFMVSLRRTMNDLMGKMAKRCKLKSIKDWVLYYKKTGEDWIEVKDYECTLRDAEITSGTFVTVANRNVLPNSHNPYNRTLNLGALTDVLHPQSNEWLLCHTCDFDETLMNAVFHIQRESYTREFSINVQECINRIFPPKLRSKPEVYTQCNLNLPGVYNLGNTCFINTIIQCLVNTPLLSEYLDKQTYRSDFSRSQKMPYLLDELAKLAQKLNEQKDKGGVMPTEFKKAIDQNLPQFSGYEQHDAQEFLNLLLDSMSDEVKRRSTVQSLAVNQNSSMTQDMFESVIKELFMGKTVNTLECQKCHKKSMKVEDYFTLSLPIPLYEDITITVCLFRKYTRLSSPPLTRYGVKVSKFGTLKDLYTAFEKVSGLPFQRFELAEVYRNSIHKLFMKFDPKVPIRQFAMKNNYTLFAYEILRGYKEVEDECQELMTLTMKKKDYTEKDWVDVEDKQGEWRHGQIVSILAKQGEKHYRVQLHYPATSIHLIQQCHGYQIAPFRSKVNYKTNIALSTVIHRIYNVASDTLEKFATPFMLVVPLQLTWKEFRVLVYNQAKRFIDFDYVRKKKLQKKEVKDSRQLYQMNRESLHNDLATHRKHNAQSVYLGSAPDGHKKLHRKTEQDLEDYMTRQRGHSQQFIQEELSFLSEPDFPYRLRLLDQSTLCCIQCDRITSYQNKQLYCQGCELEMVDQPINYNQNTLISLDWIESLAFNPLSTMAENDESHTKMIEERLARRDRIVPEQCFSLLTQEEKVEVNCDQCKSKQQANTKFTLDHTPNILVLHLKRFLYRDGYLEKIENDIDFPLKSLNLKKWSHNQSRDKIYDLYAVANHFGNGQYGHYTAYVLKMHQGREVWVHCDDDQMRQVQADKVLSQYAYLLFYRKREFPTSAILNLTYKN